MSLTYIIRIRCDFSMNTKTMIKYKKNGTKNHEAFQKYSTPHPLSVQIYKINLNKKIFQSLPMFNVPKFFQVIFPCTISFFQCFCFQESCKQTKNRKISCFKLSSIFFYNNKKLSYKNEKLLYMNQGRTKAFLYLSNFSHLMYLLYSRWFNFYSMRFSRAFTLINF